MKSYNRSEAGRLVSSATMAAFEKLAPDDQLRVRRAAEALAKGRNGLSVVGAIELLGAIGAFMAESPVPRGAHLTDLAARTKKR